MNPLPTIFGLVIFMVFSSIFACDDQFLNPTQKTSPEERWNTDPCRSIDMDGDWR